MIKEKSSHKITSIRDEIHRYKICYIKRTKIIFFPGEKLLSHFSSKEGNIVWEDV